MKTSISLGVLFLAILFGGYFWSVRQVPQPAPQPVTTQTATTTDPSRYTQAQVATHNVSKDCWAIIQGNVYDLTSWIAQHPGGKAAILTICGKDGTSAFEGQHAGNGQVQNLLATFKVGTIAS